MGGLQCSLMPQEAPRRIGETQVAFKGHVSLRPFRRQKIVRADVPGSSLFASRVSHSECSAICAKSWLTCFRGEALHGLPPKPPHWSSNEGLYPLQAMVQPIALRFKYHFQGSRSTNRVDKVNRLRLCRVQRGRSDGPSLSGLSRTFSIRYTSSKASSRTICSR
jgi:hypothetical protein